MQKITSLLYKHKGVTKPYLIKGNSLLTYSATIKIVYEARKLLSRYISPSSNIALLAYNTFEYVIGYWAILSMDSTVIPLNPQLTLRELMLEIRYADCNWLLYESRFEERASILSNALDIGAINIGSNCSLTFSRKSKSFKRRANDSSIAIMLHTSGTTGNPKKVMLSHGNLLANVQSHIMSLSLRTKDIVLIGLPIYFGYCNTAQFLAHTKLGGTICFYNNRVFTGRDFCLTVSHHSVTTYTAVPTMLLILNAYRSILNHRLNSLRYICFGGGPMDVNILHSLQKTLPHVYFVETYGQTECGPRVTALLPKDNSQLDRRGSIGKAIPNVKVEIVDAYDKPVKPGIVGEIRVRSKSVMKGYYRNVIETKKALRNGWIYTGDLAKYDNQYYLYLVGRKRNVIISGGINIYPEEIEEVLRKHPGVSDVIVHGLPDALLGEIVVANLIAKKASGISLKEIELFLDDKLAKYKWPKQVTLSKTFERTFNGKIKRTGFT